MAGIQKKKIQKPISSAAVKAALVDGLLSDSSTHIQMLLQTKDSQLMSDTMQQLALNPKSIEAFIIALSDSVQKHPQSADRALQWLNRLMECHSGYIVSSPELTARLRQLRSGLQLRVANFERLLMLKGKLDLLLSLHSDSQSGIVHNAVGDKADVKVNSTVVYEELDESEVSEEEDEEAADRGLTGQLLGNGEASEDESEAMEEEDEDDDEEEESANLSDLSSSEAADDDEDLEEEEEAEEEEEDEEDDESQA